jgi:hypothetical protein
MMADTVEAQEAPVVVIGDANPWNHLRYGSPAVPEGALEGFALFPSSASADGVDARPVVVVAKFDALGAACVRERTGKTEHYLPLSRVCSETTLARKRAAYVEMLEAKARMRRDDE